MFCETITFFLTPAVQLDTDHTMVNSSPVTSLSYLESRLILVTKSTAPTAKQRQLLINCKSYDEEYEATLHGDLDYLQTLFHHYHQPHARIYKAAAAAKLILL